MKTSKNQLIRSFLRKGRLKVNEKFLSSFLNVIRGEKFRKGQNMTNLNQIIFKETTRQHRTKFIK